MGLPGYRYRAMVYAQKGITKKRLQTRRNHGADLQLVGTLLALHSISMRGLASRGNTLTDQALQEVWSHQGLVPPTDGQYHGKGGSFRPKDRGKTATPLGQFHAPPIRDRDWG